MEKLSINAEFLFEFNNFSSWVNSASARFKPFKYGFHCVALDTENNVCHQGADFMNARDKGLFPVKVYALQRAVQPEFQTL